MPASRPRLGWLLLVAWLNAALFALLTPPWQAPDEPGHFEYACLLHALGRPLRAEDRSPALQAEIIASLDRHGFWRAVRQPQPDPLPASFEDDPFLLRSARQVGDEPPLYYLPAAAVCGLPWTVEARARAMRLLGAGWWTLAVAAVAWGWRGRPQPGCEEPPGFEAVARWQPWVMALLPMPAFIAGSVNNDGLALAASSLVLAAALRGVRLGWSARRVAGMAAALALALASKKTTAFLLPFDVLLLAAGLNRLLAARGWSRRSRGLLLAGGLLALALVSLAPTPAPAGWRTVAQPHRAACIPAARQWLDGPAVLLIDCAADADVRLAQSVDAPELAGQRVVATVWVRSPGPAPVVGRLLLRDAAGESVTSFVAREEWVDVQVQRTLASDAAYVRLVLAPTEGAAVTETGALLAARATLRPVGAPATLLSNGDFRAPARLAERMLAPLEGWAQQFAPRPLAAEPASWPRLALYTALTFAGFWGNFGWLQRPLPVPVYAALAAATLLAAAGVWMRLRRGPAAQRPMLTSWLLAVGLISLQTFLPMLGRGWQPQGRYLFPALLPVTGLLLAGWEPWLRRLSPRWGMRLLLPALLALDLLGLVWAAWGG